MQYWNSELMGYAASTFTPKPEQSLSRSSSRVASQLAISGYVLNPPAGLPEALV